MCISVIYVSLQRNEITERSDFACVWLCGRGHVRGVAVGVVIDMSMDGLSQGVAGDDFLGEELLYALVHPAHGVAGIILTVGGLLLSCGTAQHSPARHR